MYISLASSFDHCTQGGTGDGSDKFTDSKDHEELQDRLPKDNNDGWIDEVELLSEEEYNTLEEDNSASQVSTCKGIE